MTVVGRHIPCARDLVEEQKLLVTPTRMPTRSSEAPPSNTDRTAAPISFDASLERSDEQELLGLVAQLSKLAEYSAEVMSSLLSSTLQSGQRIDAVGRRIYNVSEAIADMKRSVTDSITVPCRENEWHQSRSVVGAVYFSRSNLPDGVAEQYAHSKAPPPLDLLDEYNVNGGPPPRTLYSDPEYFQRQWLEAQQKQEDQAVLERRKKREERERMNRIPSVQSSGSHSKPGSVVAAARSPKPAKSAAASDQQKQGEAIVVSNPIAQMSRHMANVSLDDVSLAEQSLPTKPPTDANLAKMPASASMKSTAVSNDVDVVHVAAQPEQTDRSPPLQTVAVAAKAAVPPPPPPPSGPPAPPPPPAASTGGPPVPPPPPPSASAASANPAAPGRAALLAQIQGPQSLRKAPDAPAPKSDSRGAFLDQVRAGFRLRDHRDRVVTNEKVAADSKDSPMSVLDMLNRKFRNVGGGEAGDDDEDDDSDDSDSDEDWD